MKGNLRKALRAQRRSLTAKEHSQRSNLAAAIISRLAAFKSGARVAMYLPFDGETNTAALLAAARRRRIRIFVPVVSDLRHRRLRFYPLSGRTRRGVFGISVPLIIPRRSGRALEPRWFDLIVVPLVGVDPQGRRLGMGGGFYDRALGFRRHRRHWMGPRLVGFGFDCQRVDSVFADPWDVRLDALATESGLRLYSKDML
ncbi:MAG: 5-formyltetrahydrofolate cyclo-ligase [Steroidobacteraceae bacterium]